MTKYFSKQPCAMISFLFQFKFLFSLDFIVLLAYASQIRPPISDRTTKLLSAVNTSPEFH